MEKLHPHYAVGALADALEVSKSGFHAHRHKPCRPRRQHDATLRPLIVESFARSRQTYGCRRVRADLQALGQRCGKNRLARLMRQERLCPRQKRRFRPTTTDSRHEHKAAENWLFLAFTLDACTRRCVAHHCRADMRGELTTTTLALALHREPPPPGLLHHSDRGVQYAAEDFAALTAAHGVTRSMSRTANPYDNALAESFVATLKAEALAGQIPPTRQAARLMLFDYIETFYNPHRRHSSLGYLSPLQFETQIFPPNHPPTKTH